MATIVTFIRAVCFLIVTQLAACQQEGDVESSETIGCPALFLTSLRLVCTGPDGPQNCAQAEVGAKAHVTWKKSVLPSGVGTELVCKETGVWKAVRTAGSSSRGDATTRYHQTSTTTVQTSTSAPPTTGGAGLKMPAITAPTIPIIPKII